MPKSITRMRMDKYSKNDRNGSTGVLNKRREIDRMMKKARQEGDPKREYWNKKLLEVEEKDPGRWNHNGYKELYVESDNSEDDYSNNGSPRTSKTVRSFRRSKSPNMRFRSGPSGRRSTSSEADRNSSRSRRSKNADSNRRRYSRSRSRSPIRSTATNGRKRSCSRSSLIRSRQKARRVSVSPTPRASVRNRSPITSRTNRRKSPSSRNSKENRTQSRGFKSNSRRSRSVRSSYSRSRSPVQRRRSRMKSRSPFQNRRTKRLNKSASRIRGSSSSPSPVQVDNVQKRRRRRINPKQVADVDLLSSSDCSDENCSMCRLEFGNNNANDEDTSKNVVSLLSPQINKQTTSKRNSEPVDSPPLAAAPATSSRYARSKSLSVVPEENSPIIEPEPPVEVKNKKKKKEKKKKKKEKSSKSIPMPIHPSKIKVESPSEESDGSPSPKRMTLSERFGRMAKSNQIKRHLDPIRKNIQVHTSAEENNPDYHRIAFDEEYHGRAEEIIDPRFEPSLAYDMLPPESHFHPHMGPQPPPHQLPPLQLPPHQLPSGPLHMNPPMYNGTTDEARIRYQHYKSQGLTGDLSFQDYLKWEEWWYTYRDLLAEEERNHQVHQLGPAGSMGVIRHRL